jgi:hypothetical protein
MCPHSRHLRLWGTKRNTCAMRFQTFWCFFFFCGSTVVWTQGFSLARQALYHWSHNSALFVLIVVLIGSHIFHLDWNPPTYASRVDEITDIGHNTWLVGQNGVSLFPRALTFRWHPLYRCQVIPHRGFNLNG